MTPTRCIVCHTTLPDKRAKYCDAPACRTVQREKRNAKKRQRNAGKYDDWVTRGRVNTCETCGDEFYGTNHTNKYCCTECRRAGKAANTDGRAAPAPPDPYWLTRGETRAWRRGDSMIAGMVE